MNLQSRTICGPLIRPPKMWMGLAAALAIISTQLHAEELVYPDDVFRPFYFVDVTKAPYNIDNTGKTDVTEQLRTAITDIFHGGFPQLRTKTLYFPDGTYRISGTLETTAPNKEGKPTHVARIRWIGQSRDKTILKLDDNLPAFHDPTKPAGIIKTESLGNTGNDAYQNDIWNMTLDVGVGNPGAVGIDYLASNNGDIHDVTIRAPAGSGYAGLMMNRAWPGPAFVRNLEVDGFDYGVFLTHMEYSFTFEHLVLKGQREAAFMNSDNCAFIRDLQSTNTVPVIVNSTSSGLIVVVDSKFTGGDASTPAVKNSGGLFLRNIAIDGYGNGVVNTAKDAGPGAPVGNITEYVSSPVITNKGFSNSQMTSLNLEIRETPHFVDNDFTHWYSVGNNTKPDAAAGSGAVDQADAIQAGIDEAAAQRKTTFYFIPGQYLIGHTLNFHGSIRRVLGLGAVFRTLPGGTFQTPLAEMPPPSPPKPKPSPSVASTGPAATGKPAAPALPSGPPVPSPKESILKSDYGPPVFRASDIDGDTIEFSQFIIKPNFTAVGKITCYGIGQDTKKTMIISDVESDTPVYRGSDGVGDLYIETGVGNGWFFDHPGQNIWARQLDPEGNASPKVINVGSKLWVLGLKTERPGIQVDSSKGAETEILGGLFYPVRVPNDDPIFRVDNSRFSASYVTIDNTRTPDFPQQLVEIRGTNQQVIHPTDTYPRACFGGGIAAMVPLVVAAPAATH